MTRLELPPTLRTPNLDEVPKQAEVIEAIEKSKTANIVEGFVLAYNTTKELPFKFYAEINVNNSRLWDVFKTFALHLPDEISLIFNHADDEAILGDYRDKYEIINFLENYTTELTQDCFLDFGAIHHTEDFLEEIFVDCTKYIKYWGVDEEWFRKTMNDFDISEVPELNFIDEFPKVREALTSHTENAVETVELIRKLREEYSNFEEN